MIILVVKYNIEYIEYNDVECFHSIQVVCVMKIKPKCSFPSLHHSGKVRVTAGCIEKN